MRVDPQKVRRAEIPEVVGDPSRIRDATGWEADVPLERTLRYLLDGWRERLARRAARGAALKVLLTGGTGFLGKNVARRLAVAGHSLRLLARSGSRLEGLPTDAEIVRGDVEDLESLQRRRGRAAKRSCTWPRWSRCGRPTAPCSTA